MSAEACDWCGEVSDREEQVEVAGTSLLACDSACEGALIATHERETPVAERYSALLEALGDDVPLTVTAVTKTGARATGDAWGSTRNVLEIVGESGETLLSVDPSTLTELSAERRS